MSADADAALVDDLEVTPGNVPEDPGEVLADSAYRGEVFGSASSGVRLSPARAFRATAPTPQGALTATSYWLAA